MAKRARGTTTRPGQRRPLQRPTSRPADRPAGQTTTSSSTAATPASTTPIAPRPASLTPEEESRAAQLEAEIVAEERRADDARRNRSQRAPEVVRASSPLGVAARDEYAYVARDVRRVAIVGGTLVVLLLALWVVTQATGIAL